MIKTIWFLLVASIIAASITWLLDNNGSITIYWLGYEAKTDILTAILLIIFFTLSIFVIAYTSARILSVKHLGFTKLFKKKNDQQPI